MSTVYPHVETAESRARHRKEVDDIIKRTLLECCNIYPYLPELILAEEVIRVRADLHKALEALRPFAELGSVPQVQTTQVKDDACYVGQAPKFITFGDLRRALAAYDQGKVTICDSAHTEGE